MDEYIKERLPRFGHLMHQYSYLARWYHEKRGHTGAVTYCQDKTCSLNMRLLNEVTDFVYPKYKEPPRR